MPSKTATASSTADSIHYTALPATGYPQNVIILPYYHPPAPNPILLFLRRCLAFTVVAILLSSAVFFLYPSHPQIKVVRIELNKIQVQSSPRLTLDVSLSLTVKVRNPDFYSLDYDYLWVSIGYRGRQIGVVRSEGGTVKARGSSYVNATLDFDGLEFFEDAFYLIGDLAKGVVLFDTTTTLDGHLGLLFFEIPIEGKVSCEVYVSTNNQTVVRQNCYPL
ncbi:hypothetical protein LINGRAHAP2_LOCUS20673 [Linum grandiflorum]